MPTTIECLRPQLPDRPKCCGTVTDVGTKGWRARYYHLPEAEELNCQRMAAYTIDGKPYCRTHAGFRALEILMGKGDK